MYCRSAMHPATFIRKDATIAEAVKMMTQKHLQYLLVVGPHDEFIGELSALQFAKLLLPPSVGLQFGVHMEAAKDESIDVMAERLRHHHHRPIADFIDHDIPVVRPDTPLIDALMLLRGGAVVLPVVEGPHSKLIGVVSMLKILRLVEGIEPVVD